MLTQVDTIFSADYIIPIVPQGIVLEQHSVVVHAGKIINILPTAQVDNQYQAHQVVDLKQQVLLPGLINLHAHAAMNLMRGLADDLQLMTWLQQHIWPAEAKVMSAKFVRDGTLLAAAEMLKSGTTCFNDMYFFPQAAAEAVSQSGLRATLGLVVLDFATQYAKDADEYLAKGLDFRDGLRNQTKIEVMFAPHAPYSVSDDSFNQLIPLAAQLNLGVHTHLHETQDEIAQSLAQFQLRPLQRLAQLGLLSPQTVFAHAVHLTDSEIEFLAKTGCHVAHCPSSNLKLASGFAPIVRLLSAGVNVGLGTDGAASNNKLDMFAEMRLAALLAKAVSGDASAVNAHQALAMATINGAKALGRADEIGSLEVGKYADLIAVDLSQLEASPIYDVASHLVYAAGREHVTHVWVAGELQYMKQNGADVFNGIEPNELREINQYWQPILNKFKH